MNSDKVYMYIMMMHIMMSYIAQINILIALIILSINTLHKYKNIIIKSLE